ncbi:9313_t:CDS:2, partial [Funneliformis geosporum]
YIYSGKLDLNEQAENDILDLIVASDELLLDELVTSVQEYLIKNQTECFPKLEKNILLGLIKQDLQIDEIELWNYLIKWGIAQTSELEGKQISNLSSWDEKDFMALKRSLKQFIENIRSFDISSKDFINIFGHSRKCYLTHS